MCTYTEYKYGYPLSAVTHTTMQVGGSCGTLREEATMIAIHGTYHCLRVVQLLLLLMLIRDGILSNIVPPHHLMPVPFQDSFLYLSLSLSHLTVSLSAQPSSLHH